MGKKNVNITRKKADELILKLLERAKEINTSTDKYKYPYKVKRIIVFGSYLSEKEHLGDIDIFYERAERWEDRGEMIDYFQDKSTSNDFLTRLFHADILFKQQLRQGHKSYSFHEIEEFNALIKENKKLRKKFNYKEIFVK